MTQQTSGSSSITSASGTKDVTPAPNTAQAFGKTRRRTFGAENAPAVISLVVVAVVFQTQSQFFLTGGNLVNLCVQITPLIMVALAESIVLLMREIDLSLGSVIGVCAAIASSLLVNSNMNWFLAIIVTVLCGAAIGGFQGAVIVIGAVPSFIVTLAGFLAWLGVQLQVLGSGGGLNVHTKEIVNLTTTDLPKTGTLVVVCALVAVRAVVLLIQARRSSDNLLAAFFLEAVPVGVVAIGATLALNSGGGVPLAFVVTIAIVAAVATWLRHTPAGRHVYAIGGSEEASRRVGVKVRTLRWFAFVAAGALAAFGGILSVSYSQGASTLTGGSTLLLEGIGAAVIGGVSLLGGRGSAWGAVIGALILGGVDNGLNLTNHSVYTKYVIEAFVLLLVVLVDSGFRNYRSLSLQNLRGSVRRLTVRIAGRP